MQHLYRHFDREGALLYVGVSLSAIHRLGQHADHSHWFSSITRVEIETFETREEVLAAERGAIIKENPKHNLKRPKEECKRAIAEQRHIEESRVDLVRNVVQFNPVYTIEEAARALSTSTKGIRYAISKNQLGHLMIPNGGGTPKCYVSGWQLMDYIESLQGKMS